MAKKESTQHKLDRVRKPRVQITYDVEVNGAMQLKELPFVVGVMGDFSGKPDQPLPPMKERKFVEIDRDNFDKVLAGMSPRLALRIDDKLSGKAGQNLNVELRFKSMDDFEPENVVKQVAPMRKLLETRDKLKDLLNKMEGNDKLEALLEDIIKNNDSRDKLSQALGVEGAETKEPGQE
ncbi:MAG TPA: type VI secretion system contractile sheath small subunit [Pirellulales bacterium]|jgi:type VI secretion system protein ImpB|nr:type VI secretion system contractile sheath small subunit [Pirellulales bacterium]